MKYSPANSFLLLLITIAAACSTTPRPAKDLSQESIIPKPLSTSATGSSYVLTQESIIYLENKSLNFLGEYLKDIINKSTGIEVEIQFAEATTHSGIYLNLKGKSTSVEGYEITIDEKSVELSAADPQGIFYAIQTLRQLIPIQPTTSKEEDKLSAIASGKIEDAPEYQYRGTMLDVARHFFTVEDVKRYIDLLSMYKMNTLHLHLSDDQGWRVEIKSWPNLTVVGSSKEVGGTEGGFYTQEEYKDIVEYASERFVTVVPEIDMPGHTNAALASYAELNCDGQATELYTGTEVGFSTLCTDKEVTYQFVDDVIRELAQMTPGPYIHIGGDESHVTAMEDYVPFIERAQDIVKKYGKTVMGWDEIAHAKLEPSSVVQWWAKVENAKMGVAQGAKVLVSPATNAYLDMQYDSTTHLGLHWAGYTEVDSAYIWDPVDIAEDIPRENIIGVEAPLWTETVTNMDELEYLVFPRLPGIAEIGWTPKSSRNWDEYKMRLGKQKARFEALGIDYYASKLVPWE
ncbi:MAG: beta-N-acetylhexosaminidase [Cyclobacteriaceae bacterium]